jgi:hypothetical protein
VLGLTMSAVWPLAADVERPLTKFCKVLVIPPRFADLRGSDKRISQFLPTRATESLARTHSDGHPR